MLHALLENCDRCIRRICYIIFIISQFQFALHWMMLHVMTFMYSLLVAFHNACLWMLSQLFNQLDIKYGPLLLCGWYCLSKLLWRMSVKFSVSLRDFTNGGTLYGFIHVITTNAGFTLEFRHGRIQTWPF